MSTPYLAADVSQAWRLGALGGSGPQVSEDGQEPAVGLIRRKQVQLGEDAADVLADRGLGNHQLLGDCAVAGPNNEAATAYQRAAALASTDAERDFLRRGGRAAR
jgi:hypothetical protein